MTLMTLLSGCTYTPASEEFKKEMEEFYEKVGPCPCCVMVEKYYKDKEKLEKEKEQSENIPQSFILMAYRIADKMTSLDLECMPEK